MLGLSGRFPSAPTSATVPSSSSIRPGRGRNRWHSCSELLFGGISTTSGCSFYPLLRSALPLAAQLQRRGRLAWSWVFSFSIPIRWCWFQYPLFPEYSKKYFLKGGPLLWVVFSQGQVVGVELLIGRRVYYLRVDFLFVVVFGKSAPFYSFSTSARQTDAVDI